MFNNAEDHTITNDVKMIHVWLTICSLYAAETCAKTLTIYIYKTPFNKSLPDNKLTTLSSETLHRKDRFFQKTYDA